MTTFPIQCRPEWRRDQSRECLSKDFFGPQFFAKANLLKLPSSKESSRTRRREGRQTNQMGTLIRFEPDPPFSKRSSDCPSRRSFENCRAGSGSIDCQQMLAAAFRLFAKYGFPKVSLDTSRLAIRSTKTVSG